MSYDELKVWAEMYSDAQGHRIRLENRIRSAEVFPDIFKDPLGHALANEHEIRLALRRSFKKTAPPGVITWAKDSKGVGIDLLARLVGHLGHPRNARPMHWEGTGEERKLIDDPPYERSIAQLWAYCGHGDPDRKPFAGMDAEDAFSLGRPKLKMLTHLIAECCIKQPGATIPDPATCRAKPMADPPDREPFADGPRMLRIPNALPTVGNPFHPGHDGCETHISPAGVDDLDGATETKAQAKPIPVSNPWPYRAIYDQRRLATFDRSHQDDCRRCGPSGKPATPGSPWSKAHQHADALRIVGKAVLRDLWIAAEDQ